MTNTSFLCKFDVPFKLNKLQRVYDKLTEYVTNEYTIQNQTRKQKNTKNNYTLQYRY